MNNKKIIAYVENIGIYGVEYGFEDCLITKKMNSKNSRMVKNKIYYTSLGQPYFKKYGIRYNLDECLRIF